MLAAPPPQFSPGPEEVEWSLSYPTDEEKEGLDGRIH